MELTHNVFASNLRRPLNIDYSQYASEFTPRTARIKGFVGDLNTEFGRSGVFGQYRSHGLMHSMARSKSHPQLNFETKSGYKKTRQRIGKSNRSQDPLHLKSQRSFPDLARAATASGTIRLKKKEYATMTIENAIKKRKKLGIKTRRKKRPKSCPGYNGMTQRALWR